MVDESRNGTADRVAKYRTDYQVRIDTSRYYGGP